MTFSKSAYAQFAFFKLDTAPLVLILPIAILKQGFLNAIAESEKLKIHGC